MNCCLMETNAQSLPVFFVMLGLVIIISLVILLVKTGLNCMIFNKTGYSWAWGLLTLVPIANIILPFVLALGDWPVRKELRRLKDAARTQAT